MTSRDERKVVTVLFADLAGSTEVAQRHDPEQLRQLLAAFYAERAVRAALARAAMERA